MGRGGVVEVVCIVRVSKDFPLTFAESCTCLLLAFKVWVKVLKIRKALKNQLLKSVTSWHVPIFLTVKNMPRRNGKDKERHTIRKLV